MSVPPSFQRRRWLSFRTLPSIGGIARVLQSVVKTSVRLLRIGPPLDCKNPVRIDDAGGAISNRTTTPGLESRVRARAAALTAVAGPVHRMPFAPIAQRLQHRTQRLTLGGEDVFRPRWMLVVEPTLDHACFLQRLQPRRERVAGLRPAQIGVAGPGTCVAPAAPGRAGSARSSARRRCRGRSRRGSAGREARAWSGEDGAASRYELHHCEVTVESSSDDGAQEPAIDLPEGAKR